MQALILAAGPCTRLRPLTNDRHKCLVEITPGWTVLDSELSVLRKHGITDIVIVIGYFGENIRRHIAKHYSDLQVTYVENPIFITTNCIYSTWLAREYLREDVMFLTGDLVFGKTVVEKLLSAREESVMYVNPEAPLPEKDFKARIGRDGTITEIGVNVFGPDARFCWPLYRLSKRAWQVWIAEMDQRVEAGDRNLYAEAAFNRIPEKIRLYPAYMTDFCQEVDDERDLEKVQKHVHDRIA